ncbi:MAG: acyl-CoA thioesterase [Phycisphaerales bacterium]
MSTPAPRNLALRVVTLPRDTNQYGTIFGGVILAYIDQAGFVEARRHGQHRWVTVSMDKVEFKKPVHLGDIVSFYARTVRQGTSSVTVEVEVESERYIGGEIVPVTRATLVMVAVDDTGKAIPFRAAPESSGTEPFPAASASPRKSV